MAAAFDEMTPLIPKVIEAPDGTPIGDAKVKVVLVVGLLTGTVCPPPCSVSELNSPGSLTLIVAAVMSSVMFELLITVKVPPCAVWPGKALLFTAVAVA